MEFMKKYYQVFISSVSNEFKKERVSLTNSLLKSNRFFPISMENMTGINDTVEMLYNYMQNTDIYLLLLGEKYGTIIGENKALTEICENNEEIKNMIDDVCAPKDDVYKISYTELEYIFAKCLNKKIGVFIKESVEKKCTKKKCGSNIQRLYKSIRSEKTYNVWKKTADLSQQVLIFSEQCAKGLIDTTNGWIRETDSKIFQSAQKAGIMDISLDGKIDAKTFEEHLETAKTLKLFFTTGFRFFDTYKEQLKEFVRNGGNIQFLCCKPSSKVLEGVKISEEKKGGYLNRDKINQEYNKVIIDLTDIYNYGNNTDNQGTINVRFSEAMFRASLVICDRGDSEEVDWGWLTITLPPAKAQDTVSLELFAYNDKSNILVMRAEQHFDSAWEMAENTNIKIPSNEKYEFFSDIIISSDKIKYWKDKEKTILDNQKNGLTLSKVLIEVAAQHPLNIDGSPAPEFSKRLDRAVEVYNEYNSKQIAVEIYVPGSLHMDNNKNCDKCSLSEAGKKYLIARGIPENIIHSDDLNDIKYPGRHFDGVYNTADECYVAAQYYKSNNFDRLITICSPNQLMRKTLFYVENGIIPEVITVPLEKMAHNFFYELFSAIPYVLTEDHNWQSENSKEAKRTRKERDSTYIDCP